MFVPVQGERPPSGPVVQLEGNDSLVDVPGFDFLGALLQQDVENLRYIQNGMKASSGGVLRLSRYQEQRIRHYHETLERYLTGDLCSARREPPRSCDAVAHQLHRRCRREADDGGRASRPALAYGLRRTAARRVGKEGVSQGGSRCGPKTKK